MERNDERYVESEIDRIRGELKLKQVSGPSSDQVEVRAAEAEAEQSYIKAIEVARRRGAKSLELRAAISLSRMYLSRGRDTDAQEILRPIHDWFAEGFECLELKAARDILKDIDSASKSPSASKRQPPSLAR
jgi:predicted ATPase